MNEGLIYDFEGVFENAFAVVLMAAGLKATTSIDAVAFHKDRPRVDVFFSPGAELQPSRYFLCSDNISRPYAFSGMLTLSSITGAKNEDKAVHAVYRATLRALLAGKIKAVNTALPYHQVINAFYAGADDIYNPRADFEVTADTWHIDFVIKPGAFSVLFQTPPTP